MQKLFLPFFMLFVVIGIAFLFFFFWYETNEQTIAEELLNLRKVGDSNVGLEKEEKKIKDIQSYYTLSRFKIFSRASEHSKVYVDALISLGYPYHDHETEKEIIYRKEEIRSLIQRHISTKTYRELDTAEKKETLKVDLLYGINDMMKRPVSDIYYIEFMVIVQ